MAAGNIKVSLGGASYNMKPSYDAMRDIEDRTDFTIAELLEVLVAQRIKIQEVVTIIWFGCQSAGEAFDNVEAVGKVVFEQKISNPRLRKSLSEFLLACLYSPEDAKKKFDEDVAPMLVSTETG